MEASQHESCQNGNTHFQSSLKRHMCVTFLEDTFEFVFVFIPVQVIVFVFKLHLSFSWQANDEPYPALLRYAIPTNRALYFHFHLYLYLFLLFNLYLYSTLSSESFSWSADEPMSPIPPYSVMPYQPTNRQSCKTSYLLHRTNLSNQTLPHEKCINCNKINT